MNNFLDQLNLTPSERRIVVVIFLVVIVVLNLLFVWPRFGDWAKINKQLNDLRNTEALYNRNIEQDLNPTNGWRKQVEKMARLEGGSTIDTSVDPQNQLQQTIIQQERKTGVTVGSFSPGPVKTNAFFEEHSTAITFESQEEQLVKFLYSMGNDPAMIRVAKIDLHPTEPNRYTLKGSITLTANYAKQNAPAAASAPAKPNFGPKPAAAQANKPGSTKPGAPLAGPANAKRASPGGGGPPLPGGNRPPQPGQKQNPLGKLVPGKPGAGQKVPAD